MTSMDELKEYSGARWKTLVTIQACAGVMAKDDLRELYVSVNDGSLQIRMKR